MREKLRNIDYYILVPYLILSAVGIVMVYSSSSDLASMRGQNPSYYLIRQVMWVIVGLGVTTFFYSLKLSVFHKGATVTAYLAAVFIGMVVLKFTGTATNGATAWISLGPINIQPSEFAKLGLILYLAHMFSLREKRSLQAQTWAQWLARSWGPLVIVLLLLLLTLAQPDVGGFSILLTIAFVMALTSGVTLRSGFSLGGIGVLGVSVGYFLITHLNIGRFLHGYQAQRLLAFVDPFKLSKGAGQQLINSYYAIHNGGLFGAGLGNSIQKKGYLPEPNTDFIIAVTAEELGVIAVIILIGLIFFLTARITLIGIRAKDPFNALMCIGIGTMLFIQTTFNLGGVSGLLPITGVTFPFVSYGGSSMLVLTMSIGLVLNISAMEKRRLKAS